MRTSEPFAAKISGSSTFRGTVEAADLDLEAEGASRAILSGSAKSAKIVAEGASHLQLGGFENETVDIKLSGALHAKIAVNRSLDYEVSSASHLTYKGNPSHVEGEAHGRIARFARVKPLFYTGPKWSELNAVRASAELSPSGNFTFTGTSAGAINKGPAVYVWGVDRNGNLPPGPFTSRPDIKFDAVVVVAVNPSLAVTAQVVDLDERHHDRLARGLGDHSRTHRHGQRRRELVAVDRPRAVALSVQFLARGWWTGGFLVCREFRTGAHHRSGRDPEMTGGSPDSVTPR